MNKKFLISTAATIALLVTPLVGNADAAAGTPDVPAKNQTKQSQKSNCFIWMKDKYNYKFPQWNKAPQNPSTEVPNQEQEKPQQPNPTPSEKPTGNEEQQTTGELSAFEQKVVELTNQERSKNGLPALKIDTELSKVAREKSNDMQKNNYFDHNSPTYGSPFDMMKQFGISYRAAGENIAMGQRSPEEVVKGWMDSPGHRENILSKNFTHIGVGYAENGNYWTQMFIGK